MIKELSRAQRTTLATIIANGGEMNSYAGQKGFYCVSIRPLVKAGYLADVPACNGGRACLLETGDACTFPINGQECYLRVKITDAGRNALGAMHAALTVKNG